MKLYKFGFQILFLGCLAPEALAQQNNPLQIIPKPTSISPAKTHTHMPELDALSIAKRANLMLNSINTMIADFSQTNSLGQGAEGKLYLLRPGRLKFEYSSPSTIEIVADGTSLAVRNKKLNTQDVYFIRQTPLKFLLKQNINLAQDMKLVGVSSDAENTILKMEDKSTFGGTSKIELFFRNSDFILSQWVIIDAQGSETKVRLSNIDLSKRPDRSLFTINFDRFDNQ
jgi:outer membrane lipoprotein-sorting protein